VLTQVSCSAVGACVAVDEGGQRAVTLSGGSWQAVTLPSDGLNPSPPPGAPVALNSLGCSGDGACAGVGYYYDSSNNYHAVLVSLSGTTWSVVNAPSDGLNPAAAGTGLGPAGGSCAAPESCAVVGAYGDSNSVTHGYLAALAGGSWSASTAPDAGLTPAAFGGSTTTADSIISAVSCLPHSSCLGVGEYFASDQPSNQFPDEHALLETLPGAALSPPTVTTDVATSIAGSSATLEGSVNPAGLTVTDCHFEYGTSSSYGQTVPCAQSVGDGDRAVPVSATVSGLTPGTLYHFRLDATNGAGSASGRDETFTASSRGAGCTTPKSPSNAVGCPPETKPMPNGDDGYAQETNCRKIQTFCVQGDELTGRIEGIYARVLNYSPYVGPNSDPGTSAWVMLSYCSAHLQCDPYKYAQIGWLEPPGVAYGQPGRVTLIQVNPGSLTSSQTCGTNAAGGGDGLQCFSRNNGTTAAQTPEPLGTYTYYTVLWSNEPDSFTFYVNGQRVAKWRAPFVPNFAIAVGEIHSTLSQMPGDATVPEVFSDVHVFRNGAWVPFTPTSGTASNGTSWNPIDALNDGSNVMPDNGLHFGHHLYPASGSCPTMFGIWDRSFGDATSVLDSLHRDNCSFPASPAYADSPPRVGHGGLVTLGLRCSAGQRDCRGKVSLQATGTPFQSLKSAAVETKRKAHRSRLLTRKVAFALPPGAHEHVRLHLTRAALRALRRLRHIAARIVVTAPGPRGRTIRWKSRRYTLSLSHR
jgi:hypothetical protein